MALVVKDRVRETTSTAGTGTITLAGAVTGYQSFSTIGNGNTTYYCIAGQGTSEWEVGIGTYTSAGTTLSRTTVLASSNAGSLVTFSAGVKDVFVTWPAYQAQPFVYGESTTAPNATVYVDSITSNAASTNADVALVARGNGATLAHVPDSTATGGNKRGIYATDLQKNRSTAAQVASGNYAVIGGGSANTADGLFGTVAGGNGNAASGFYSSVIGGASNLATGDYSTVVGGLYGTTRLIGGYVVFPASGTPIASTQGCTQAGLLILGVQTTNATATVICSDNTAASTFNQIILPNNSAYYFRGSVIANVTGGGNTKAWSFEGAIKRGANAAATTLVNSVINTVAQDAGASTWTIALAADTTNGGLQITVTGQASTTIRWVGKVETTEVTY